MATTIETYPLHVLWSAAPWAKIQMIVTLFKRVYSVASGTCYHQTPDEVTEHVLKFASLDIPRRAS
jgi:hypothetical protein